MKDLLEMMENALEACRNLMKTTATSSRRIDLHQERIDTLETKVKALEGREKITCEYVQCKGCQKHVEFAVSTGCYECGCPLCDDCIVENDEGRPFCEECDAAKINGKDKPCQK